MPSDVQWTRHAASLAGPGFALFHRKLAEFNHRRLQPQLPASGWSARIREQCLIVQAETEYVEAARREIAPLLADIPTSADGFIDWFEALETNGPGQGDPLFPWLATSASLEQIKWFVEQEVAGEAGFDDLVALTQIKMPEQAKLEMARNYWDEMGRGASKGMHGPMLSRLAAHLAVRPTPATVVPEALALGNTMIALASNRHYAFHSVGALGAIEMTAPARAAQVDRGLRRLAVPAKQRHYFALHAVLDVRH